MYKTFDVTIEYRLAPIAFRFFFFFTFHVFIQMFGNVTSISNYVMYIVFFFLLNRLSCTLDTLIITTLTMFLNVFIQKYIYVFTVPISQKIIIIVCSYLFYTFIYYYYDKKLYESVLRTKYLKYIFCSIFYFKYNSKGCELYVTWTTPSNVLVLQINIFFFLCWEITNWCMKFYFAYYTRR